MKQVSEAFVKAQREFGPALKSNTNPHFKSKYADLSACVEAVIDALNNNGIALMQRTHASETGVTVETTFIHESGEMLSAGSLHFPAAKIDAQGFMSALTYCRRGHLMAACGIAPEDDDGNAASKKQTPRQPALGGIGDDLPPDWKIYLEDLAKDVVALVAKQDFEGANRAIHAEPLDDTQTLYMERFLDSKTRSAVRKFNESNK